MAGNRTVSVFLTANIAGYSAAIQKAKLQTADFAKSAEKNANDHKQSWEKVGTGMMVTGGVIALGVGMAVKAFMDFDKEMSTVKAVSNASAADMDKLSQAAIKAGADTVFSASEAAKAEGELAKAGVSTADILGGALTGSLNLASAGGLDLADAATVAAQSMNIFKLGGSDVSHIADVLAAGANKSAADVKGLGDALKQGGLVAAQTGLSLEDTVGTLSMFADSALIGSDAGTSLKTMLMMLNPVSVKAKNAMDDIGFSAYDAQGKFVGMESVAQQLKDGLGNLSEKQRAATLTTIFGSDATRAASILYEQGAAGVRDYTSAVNDNGAAQRMAATMLDNLAGDFEALKGSIDTALIQSGSAANGVLRDMTQAVTGVVNGFGALPTGVQQGVVKFGALAAVVLVTGGALIAFVPKALAAKVAINDMGIMAGRSGSLIKGLGAAAGIAAVGIPLMTAAADAFYKSIGYGATEGRAAAESLEAWMDTGTATGENADMMTDRMNNLGETLNQVFNDSVWHKGISALSELSSGFGLLGPTLTDNSVTAFQTMDAALAQMVTSGNGDKAAQLFKQITTEASNQGIAWQDVQKAMPGYQAALDSAKVAAASAIDPITGLSGAQTDLKNKTDAAKKAIDDQVQGLLNAGLAFLSTRSATNALVEAQRAATAQAHKNKAGLEGNSKAAMANRTALDAQSTASINLAKSVYEQTKATQGESAAEKAMQGSLTVSRAALIKTYLQFNNNKAAAEKYADEVLGIPPAKKTQITNNAKAKQAEVKALKDEIASLKGKSVDVGVKANFSMGKGGANAFGFFTGATGGAVRGPGTGTSDSVPALLSNGEYVINAAQTAKHAPLLKAINSGAQGFAAGGPVGLLPPPVDTRMNQATRAFLSTVKVNPSALGGGTGGGAAQWSGLVLQVLALLGQSAANLPAVLRLINKESGGNPKAVNLWDSNAKAGHPSGGLIQTIAGTFNAYAGPFAAMGMFNPLANLYAGLNYAISRYGSIAAVDPLRHAGGYDTGGMLPPGGLGANYGKKPERVLSGQQTESFERLVSLLSSGAARGGGGATLAATNRTIVLQVNGREITRVVLDGMDNAITGGLTRVGVS